MRFLDPGTLVECREQVGSRSSCIDVTNSSTITCKRRAESGAPCRQQAFGVWSSFSPSTATFTIIFLHYLPHHRALARRIALGQYRTMLSTPSPPPSSCAAVKGPYAHFAHLKDALTISGGVTDQTALAGVYLFDNPQVDNRFIKNLTRVSHVKCRCQIVSEKNTAEAVPPTMEKSRYGYDLFLTFNQLVSHI